MLVPLLRLMVRIGFTRALGPFYSKMALSSGSTNYIGMGKSEELKKQKQFLEYFLAPLNKEGYITKTDVLSPPKTL